MHQDQIRARIKKLLQTGDIPCESPEDIWAGSGQGHSCAGCGGAIRPDEVEYEVDLRAGFTIRLHRACHMIWLEECGERTR
jgi:hypothetical protein